MHRSLRRRRNAAALLSLAAALAFAPLRAKPLELGTATVADLQSAMASGALTAEKLVQLYLARIEAFEQQGPKLASFLYLNPNALAEARALDVRTPTSDANLYGLASTSGLISRDGQMWSYLTGERGGPMARSVYDLAVTLGAIAGFDAFDLWTAQSPGKMPEQPYVSFIEPTVNIKKPVVFVGSQRPWTGLSGDGPLNLYDAVRVAASPAAAEKGVLHCMNQNSNAARDVTKFSAYRMDTFRSIDLGVMGVADPDVVKFYFEPTRRHTFKSEFNIGSLPASSKELPAVECIYAYTEAPGYLIDSLIERGVKGVVVDGTGAGSPAGGVTGQTEAIKRAQVKGIVVADNLTPEKARMLLQLALSKTSDPKEIKRIFDEY